MTKYKFKFNRKTQYFTVDPDAVTRNQRGWMSIALQVSDQINNGDVFTDDDKRRINTLTLFSIYKFLTKL